MKPKLLFLTDHEADLAAQGKLTAIVRAFKPQPRIMKGFVYDMDSGGGVEYFQREPWHFDKRIPKPGDILAGKETWSPLRREHSFRDDHYYYKADSTSDSEKYRKQYGYSWHSPILMPLSVVRHWFRVNSVRAMQAKDVPLAEYHLTDDTWLWCVELERRRRNENFY